MSKTDRSLGQAARAFTGAVSEAAAVLDERISASFARGSVSLSADQSAALRAASAAIAVHLVDRVAYRTLKPSGRELFMNGLLSSISQGRDEAALRREYNEFQKEFGGYTVLSPGDGESPSGTLFWELGKYLSRMVYPSDPTWIPHFILAEVAVWQALTQAFDQIVASP